MPTPLAQPAGLGDEAAPPPRVQFSLPALLAYIAITALISGVLKASGLGLGASLAAFAVGFVGLAQIVLLMGAFAALSRRRREAIRYGPDEVVAATLVESPPPIRAHPLDRPD